MDSLLGEEQWPNAWASLLQAFAPERQGIDLAAADRIIETLMISFRLKAPDVSRPSASTAAEGHDEASGPVLPNNESEEGDIPDTAEEFQLRDIHAAVDTAARVPSDVGDIPLVDMLEDSPLKLTTVNLKIIILLAQSKIYEIMGAANDSSCDIRVRVSGQLGASGSALVAAHVTANMALDFAGTAS